MRDHVLRVARLGHARVLDRAPMTAPPSFKSFAAPSFSSFPDLDAPKAGPSSHKLDDDVRVKERRSKKEDKEKRSRREDREKSGRRWSREREGDRDKPRRKSRERDGERKDRHRRSHRDERVRDRSRDRDDRKRHRDEHPFASDERAKAAQDAQSRLSHITSDLLEKPIFYSDKRGDPANVHYGRPDSKYVPDYRHVAGELYT